MTNATETKRTAAQNDLTELVFILDRSGSMCGQAADTIGGFNSMLEKQRPRRAALTSAPCCLTTAARSCTTACRWTRCRP